MWRAFAFVLILAAGCVAPDSGGVRAPEAQGLLDSLDFDGVYDVHNTPAVADEVQGIVRVAWQGSLHAVYSEREKAIPTNVIVQDGMAYITRNGMGWTRHVLHDAVGQGRLDNRVLLWNVPALAKDVGFDLSLENDALVAAGTISSSSKDLDAKFTIRHASAHVSSVRVESAQGYESPYRLERTTDPFEFPLQVPGTSKPWDEVESLDAAAKLNHAFLQGLIQAYCRGHAGLVPDAIDEASLRLELLASGKPWPTNPYDGQALVHKESAGHFRWEKTAPTQGRYFGHGWDGPLVLHHFGPANCSP